MPYALYGLKVFCVGIAILLVMNYFLQPPIDIYEGLNDDISNIAKTDSRVPNKLNLFHQDIDGDGVLNMYDLDIDGDGLNNQQDNDMDGDGISNEDDVDGSETNSHNADRLKGSVPDYASGK